MSASLLLALSPWAVFAFAARSGGLDLGSSALVTLGWSLAVVIRSRRVGSVMRAFELETALLFGVLVVVGYLFPDHILNAMANYDRAIAVAAFALLATSTLPFRPFTEEYTRELVPRSRLESLEFARTNTTLTAAWIITALAAAASFALGGWAPGALVPTLLNWIIPLLLVLGCLRYGTSRWYDDVEEQELVTAGLDAVSPLQLAGSTTPRPRRPNLKLVSGPAPSRH